MRAARAWPASKKVAPNMFVSARMRATYLCGAARVELGAGEEEADRERAWSLATAAARTSGSKACNTNIP